MTKKLCIEWKMNGGRGFSSPCEDTPEEKQRLEQWVGRLKQDFKHGEFAVTEYPYGRSFALPGSIAALVLARQPSGHA